MELKRGTRIFTWSHPPTPGIRVDVRLVFRLDLRPGDIVDFVITVTTDDTHHNIFEILRRRDAPVLHANWVSANACL